MHTRRDWAMFAVNVAVAAGSVYGGTIAHDKIGAVTVGFLGGFALCGSLFVHLMGHRQSCRGLSRLDATTTEEP